MALFFLEHLLMGHSGSATAITHILPCGFAATLMPVVCIRAPIALGARLGSAARGCSMRSTITQREIKLLKCVFCHESLTYRRGFPVKIISYPFEGEWAHSWCAYYQTKGTNRFYSGDEFLDDIHSVDQAISAMCPGNSAVDIGGEAY
jgi:hypothetical protein